MTPWKTLIWVGVMFLGKAPMAEAGRGGDACGANIILNADPHTGRTFQFDLCDVINCWGDKKAWTGYNVYMCPFTLGYPNPWVKECSAWINVWWWTGPDQSWLDNRPNNRGSSKPYYEFKRKVSLYRGSVWGRKQGVNPLILTLKEEIHNPFSMKGWSSQTCSTRRGSEVREHGAGGVLYLIIRADVTGRDPWGIIRINLGTHTDPGLGPTASPVLVKSSDTNKITPREYIAIETGYVEANAWVDRVVQYTTQAAIGDCWVCATGKPTLLMSPSPFEEGNDTFRCALELMSLTNPSAECKSWETYFPMAPANVTPPAFRVDPIRNITCVTNLSPSDQPYRVGNLPDSACSTWISLTGTENATMLTVSRADLWWYCGKRVLYNWLPVNWEGTCTLITLNVPLFIAAKNPGDNTLNPIPDEIGRWYRNKRALTERGERNPDGIWIDAIGQARNIPDEYKLADEVAAGFESFPLFSAIFPITTNKNVNRINLIHYNVQRLANLTRDIAEAVHEQLSQTSLMTLQNRIAIDMILAEKGGVCALFGDMCCMTIANNTGPDGSLTKGLSKLRSLANELKQQSGVNNPVLNWLKQCKK
ncbi:uncharacterized protein [Hemitrygon akajei]|uniref:uncharacterized protein n=1 Tax=Hemitrygon akajei TaxID=2704970 RepID=UPI003BF955FF